MVGGGLQSGLLTLAIRHHQPHSSILVIERASQLAGNHTWSFHESDVPFAEMPWIERLVEHRWPQYEIRVGGFHRKLQLGYVAVSSEHFAAVVESSLEASPSGHTLKNTDVVEVESNYVTTAGGQRYDASIVIDNRGPDAAMRNSFQGGYQKFWGFEVELDANWPTEIPVVMDDFVEQGDGFRFFYTLPFSSRRVLIEDTRFSNTPSLEREECWQATLGYLKHLGIGDATVVREEHGVLPMPIGHHQSAKSRLQRDRVLSGGYAGGWFHAATGYSFQLAAQFANLVASTPIERLRAAVEELASEHHWRNRYGRFLNRLMFELVSPQTRYQIFRRFYRVLDESRISRFYAHRFRASDAMRIVVGVPPGGLRPTRFASSFFRTSQREFSAASEMLSSEQSTDTNLSRATS